MYYIILIILVLFGFSEVFKYKERKKAFISVYVAMTLMAMFRFGQLGDYFEYYYNYQNPLTLRDPLFVAYASLLQLIGAKYTFFVATIELLCMGLAFPFFYRTCKKSFLSLLSFYCYTFMVCPMCAIRQAVCLSLLLYSYYLLKEKKKKRFFVIVGIGMFIHVSFFAVFLIGLYYDKKGYNGYWTWIVVLMMTFFALFSFDVTASIRMYFVDRSAATGEGANMFDNTIQVVLRLLLIIPVLLAKPKYATDEYYAKAICFMGFVIYCLLSSSNLVAGRMEYYFRTFLCLFISCLVLARRSALRNISLLLFIFLHSVMFFKNINGYISQGNYNLGVTMFNFPYISIYDKSEIDDYTSIDKLNYEEND